MTSNQDVKLCNALHGSDTLGRYLEACRVRNFSPNTIYSRSRCVHRFIAATGRDPLDLTADEMIGWWTSLRLTPSSMAGELAGIRGYCKWAVRYGHIAKDPTRLLDRPRVPRRIPRPIDEVSLGTAIANARPDVRVILCLAAYGGLRASEISKLAWADVRRDTLLLQGKGFKQRVVPSHPMIREALVALPGKRRGLVLERRDREPGHVPPWGICSWANEYMHDLGISETLHQLRHRYGTAIYQLS